MTHLFVEASRQWAAASLARTSQPAAAPVSAAPGTTTTTTASIPDRPPGPSRRGTSRSIPTSNGGSSPHELLGAEEVLATPVTLGEIVSRRTWTAARTLNIALSRTTSAANSKALRLEHGNLVPEESSRTNRYSLRDEWSPLPTGAQNSAPTAEIHPGCLQELFSGLSLTRRYWIRIRRVHRKHCNLLQLRSGCHDRAEWSIPNAAVS